jgi:hypothetical protein
MEQLQRSVIRVVRTSMSDVERRRYRRRPCLAEAMIRSEGQSTVATLHDISERGCFAVGTFACRPGQQIALELSRFGIRQQGVVVALGADGLHVAFTGDGLAADEADRVSLVTVQELVTAGKDEQAARVRRIAAAAAARGGSQQDQAPYLFKTWYDRVSDPSTVALPSFNAIAEPLNAAQDCVRKAFSVMADGDAQTAQRCVVELRQHSEQLAQCLDAFGSAYATTIARQGERAAMAAAA